MPDSFKISTPAPGDLRLIQQMGMGRLPFSTATQNYLVVEHRGDVIGYVAYRTGFEGNGTPYLQISEPYIRHSWTNAEDGHGHTLCEAMIIEATLHHRYHRGEELKHYRVDDGEAVMIHHPPARSTEPEPVDAPKPETAQPAAIAPVYF